MKTLELENPFQEALDEASYSCLEVQKEASYSFLEVQNESSLLVREMRNEEINRKPLVQVKNF